MCISYLAPFSPIEIELVDRIDHITDPEGQRGTDALVWESTLGFLRRKCRHSNSHFSSLRHWGRPRGTLHFCVTLFSIIWCFSKCGDLDSRLVDDDWRGCGYLKSHFEAVSVICSTSLNQITLFQIVQLFIKFRRRWCSDRVRPSFITRHGSEILRWKTSDWNSYSHRFNITL